MDRKTTVPQFQAGDMVRIRYSNVKRAKIVELRGALGPGGTQVYRIRVSGRPKPIYVEVTEDQMVRLPVST